MVKIMKIFLLYTDPGSGVMLLQVLLAFVASSVFYFRNFIKSFLGFGKSVAIEDVNTESGKADEVKIDTDDRG